MKNEKFAEASATVIDLMGNAKFKKRLIQSEPRSSAAAQMDGVAVRHAPSSNPERVEDEKRMSGKRPARTDPKGNVLPAGIRYVENRPKLPYRVEQELQQVNGSWRSTSKSYPTLAAAKKGLANLKLDIAQGNPPPGQRAKTSLADFQKEAQGSVLKAGRTPNTVRDYDRAWRIRILPDLGNFRLGDISPDVVEEAIQNWLESATPSTVCSALAYLSQLLDKAVAQNRIGKNPVRGVERPKSTTTTNVGERALTGGQQADLLRIMQGQDPAYDWFIQTLLHTGLRFNEATALRVTDVNLSAGVLAVNRAYFLDENGELKLGQTKGKKCRTAPIPDSLRAALQAAMQGKAPSEQLLTTPAGSTIRGSNLRRSLNWDAIRKSIGKPGMCFHDLRHTAASNMLTMGVPLHDVRAILGHSDVATTNAYSGSHFDYASRAAERINDHWKVILP
ncbi:integrase [Pseudarthrobacter defluvii]|uniref:tyrosine-type recombinase/integrase n=1 Tax=Pseudarthrobacter defluvii TaxID=410837 RepID=UPI002780F901|nr:site-specific integrase [Pseudarthrobacter defluvii]MDQ0768187.1 integrase [Pseudarthrobacter defluvii]